MLSIPGPFLERLAKKSLLEEIFFGSQPHMSDIRALEDLLGLCGLALATGSAHFFA